MKLKTNKNNNSGVTLLTLIITIVVLLILTGTTISILTGQNNVINMANEAAIKSSLSALKEEFEMNIVYEYNNLDDINVYGNDIKEYIKSIEDKDIDNFAILKGKLTYIGEDELIKEYCIDLDIDVGFLDIAILSEFIQNIEVVQGLQDKDITPINYLGDRLYDRNALNSLKWKILVEYDNDNNAVNISGSKWYYIAKGTSIDGHIVEYDYVINYETNDIKIVSNYKIWDVNSSLGVTDGLVMNIDATNMNSSDWGDIETYGNVKYMNETKSLYFDGDGDYLKLTSPGDFSKGFTFEIYANLDRLNYVINGNSASGLFTRIKSLNENDISKSMRFGYTSFKLICKFNSYSNWAGTGEKLSTLSYGDIQIQNASDMYKINEDFYLTFVYRTYKDSTVEERAALNWTVNQDRIEYYIDGVLYGYTYFDSNSYIQGCSVWNNPDTPMFIGVTQWWNKSSKYYLKGDVYSCRLYESSLSKDEVLANYNATIQWRNTEF